MDSEGLTPPLSSSSDEGRSPGPPSAPPPKRRRDGSQHTSPGVVTASQTVCSRCRGDVRAPGDFITLHEERAELVRTEFHFPNLNELVNALEIACKTKWKTRDSPYSRVIALLVHWEEDDLGVVAEIKELEEMLRDTYHFDVESWTIPTVKRCYMTLARKIDSILVNYDTQDSLFILYYGGHALQDEHRQPTWVS